MTIGRCVFRRKSARIHSEESQCDSTGFRVSAHEIQPRPESPLEELARQQLDSLGSHWGPSVAPMIEAHESEPA